MPFLRLTILEEAGGWCQAGDSLYIPLGFVAGYAIGNEKGPFIDIDPYFRFPYFVVPASSHDKIVSGLWQTGLTATVYLYL